VYDSSDDDDDDDDDCDVASLPVGPVAANLLHIRGAVISIRQSLLSTVSNSSSSGRSESVKAGPELEARAAVNGRRIGDDGTQRRAGDIDICRH